MEEDEVGPGSRRKMHKVLMDSSDEEDLEESDDGVEVALSDNL